jgi:thiol-disulfide isomerase/thioredoxin
MLFGHFAQAQVPSNVLSIEDAAFSKAYKTHPVPVVKGRLHHLTADELKNTKISYTIVTPFGSRQDKRSATLMPDGSFSFTLDYPLPYQQVWLSVGDFFYTAVIANTKLNIDIDVAKLRNLKDAAFMADGVQYSGEDGAVTEYYNRHIMYKRQEQLAISSRKSKLLFARPLPPVDSVLIAYNTIAAEQDAINESFIRENPSPYAWMIRNEAESGFIRDLSPRFWGLTMPDSLFQKMKTHKSYLVSNDGAGAYDYFAKYILYAPANRTSVSNTEIYNTPGISTDEKLALDSLIQLEKATVPEKETMARLNKRISAVKLRITEEKRNARYIHIVDSLFPKAKADLLKLQLPNNIDLNSAVACYRQLLPTVQTTWISAIAKSEQNKITGHLNSINQMLSGGTSFTNKSLPGKALMRTSFGANMYTVANMPLKTFLAKLKQSLPGKAIVIDRWATWCGPCLAEMPYSKKLMEQSKDLPVVFVYLCTEMNSDENKWKTKVAELKQPGIHYYIDRALDNEISTYFSFSGYPGYAFIDRQGKYQPGAITWMSDLSKEQLTALTK